MSEFTASAHEALLEEGVAKQKTAEKKPMSHQIMNVFLTCLGWAPLVILLAVTDQRAMVTGAAGKFLLLKYLARPRGSASVSRI